MYLTLVCACYVYFWVLNDLFSGLLDPLDYFIVVANFAMLLCFCLCYDCDTLVWLAMLGFLSVCVIDV